MLPNTGGKLLPSLVDRRRDWLGGRALYLWGAANMGLLALEKIKAWGLRPAAFVDSDPERQGGRHEGLPVLAPAELLGRPERAYFIVITSQAVDQISRACQEAGLMELADYASWYAFLNDAQIPPPPNTMPESLAAGYTMGGLIPVVYAYCDERSIWPLRNTRADYEAAFRRLETRSFEYYFGEIDQYYDALDQWDIAGRTVIVWGLNTLNCEALAVWKGAARVFVVDYNRPFCEHGNITVLTHRELEDQALEADFAISHSSFEHDGLGRYGDPLDPDGDIKAMRSAWKHLKPGGILFLGVPFSLSGQDCLRWNRHRVYGRLRLPLLLRGWSCLDLFNAHQSGLSPLWAQMAEPTIPGRVVEPLLVLRKSDQDFPDEARLAERRAALAAETPSNTRDPGLLSEVLARIPARRK
jgi:hypothetical protein